MHRQPIDGQEVHLPGQVVLVHFGNDADDLLVVLHHVVEKARPGCNLDAGVERLGAIDQLDQGTVVALHYVALGPVAVAEYLHHLRRHEASGGGG